MLAIPYTRAPCQSIKVEENKVKYGGSSLKANPTQLAKTAHEEHRPKLQLPARKGA